MFYFVETTIGKWYIRFYLLRQQHQWAVVYTHQKVMSAEERKLLDQTALHDYIFEWGDDSTQCCMAMGYVAVYNHSYKSNCEYVMDYPNQQISITTVREIKKGEELLINYNGDWDDETPLWFNAK